MKRTRRAWPRLIPKNAFDWPTCPDPVGILAGLFFARVGFSLVLFLISIF
jgi:hypothetical protein